MKTNKIGLTASFVAIYLVVAASLCYGADVVIGTGSWTAKMTYTYDLGGRVETATDQKDLTKYTYNDQGNVSRVDYADGSYSLYDREVSVDNPYGRLKSITTYNATNVKLSETWYDTSNNHKLYTKTQVFDREGYNIGQTVDGYIYVSGQLKWKVRWEYIGGTDTYFIALGGTNYSIPSGSVSASPGWKPIDYNIITPDGGEGASYSAP